jgi:glycosyltransferase involved in cell wall biosynthesis
VFNELRSSRTVVGEFSPDLPDHNATVFLGLFNASDYLKSLESQIASQGPLFKIIAVDNDSEDSTWANLQSWLDLFPGRVVLARNPLNLGASGSLYLNEDLIQTPWFITMHQDDFYKPNHVETLFNAINNADEETICITTEMASLDSAGHPRPSPPRASWFLPDEDPATIFTSNLRLHNVPYPAAAFRSSVFFQQAVPWESTAFPDTEWVLRAASLGKFQFIEIETMRYRENPTSESHSIKSDEKVFGAALSLVRVFGGAPFIRLCESIESEDRHLFSRRVLDGVRIRVGEGPTGNFVSTFANQQMASTWGYSDSFTNDKLAIAYQHVGAAFPVHLLNRINAFLQGEHDNKMQDKASMQPDDVLPQQEGKFSFSGLVLNLYGRLPTGLRRSTAKLVGAVIRFLNLKTEWNFKWK